MSEAICRYCGGTAIVGTTCPKSVECPVCGAGGGQRCQRPSGHLAPELHRDRIEAAEQLDRDTAT